MWIKLEIMVLLTGMRDWTPEGFTDRYPTAATFVRRRRVRFQASLKSGIVLHAYCSRIMIWFQMTVICTCAGRHQPMIVQIGRDGVPKSVRQCFLLPNIDRTGNPLCWFNQFKFVRESQPPDSTDRIFKHCSQYFSKLSKFWTESERQEVVGSVFQN